MAFFLVLLSSLLKTLPIEPTTLLITSSARAANGNPEIVIQVKRGYTKSDKIDLRVGSNPDFQILPFHTVHILLFEEGENKP